MSLLTYSNKSFVDRWFHIWWKIFKIVPSNNNTILRCKRKLNLQIVQENNDYSMKQGYTIKSFFQYSFIIVLTGEISPSDQQRSTKFCLLSHIWYHQRLQLLDQVAELAMVIPMSKHSGRYHIFHYFQKYH